LSDIDEDAQFCEFPSPNGCKEEEFENLCRNLMAVNAKVF